LQTNERHCGSCRNRCASTQTCCGGRYVNLKRSERHCGSCSNRCEEGSECVDGVCQGVGPICDPPCPEGRECTSGCDGCPTFCQPICPSCPQDYCYDLANGTGAACIDCTVGCPVAPNNDCSQCPPGTICVLTPLTGEPFICCQPAATCGSNGATCTDNTDCCSGRCASGVCAEPCPSGRVLLSNGTCALPCNNPADCPDCGAPLGAICSFADVGGPFCSGARAGVCGPGGSCPTGQFCSGSDCYVAC
jgi:Stigma-specific protein, Stig1